MAQRAVALPRPARPPAITWYACGPTVYDVAHVGHARTYVTLDLLRRATEALTGRTVEFALGVTDIDDKICARAAAGGETPRALARRFEAAFLAELRALGCAPPTALTRVSEHIPEVLAYVSRLVGSGSAYVVPPAGGGGASVYLSVPALGAAYGKLAPPAVRAGAGAAGGADEGAVAAARGKRDPRDFALWKGVDPGAEAGAGGGAAGAGGGAAGALAGGWAWDSPWGLGRPGWHVECSAMTRALFGGALDVHAGGVDLRFPHHCNELAQADAWVGVDAVAAGYEWVGAWLHTGHVHVAGLKMSKSLKNFTPVADVLAEGGEAAGAARAGGLRGPAAVGDAFRLWCAAHHYSAALTYAPARLGEAAAAGRRLDAFLEGAAAAAAAGGSAKWAAPERALADAWATAAAAWDGALRDDFDTPAALRAAGDAAAAGAAYLRGGGAHAGLLAGVAGGLAARLEGLGLRFAAQRRAALGDGWGGGGGAGAVEGGAAQRGPKQPSPELLALVQQREALRALAGTLRGTAPLAAAQLLAQCDAIRDKVLPGLGWTLKDGGAKGPSVAPL